MTLLMKRKRGRPRRDEPQEVNDFDLRLIQEFEKRPGFYDRNHPHYRNREHLEPKWNEISRTLGYSVSYIKNRILQLRNRYNMEKRRLETMQTSNPNVTSPWVLYDHLSFLGDHIKSRKSFGLDLQDTPNTSGVDDYDEDSESHNLHNSNIVMHSKVDNSEHVEKKAKRPMNFENAQERSPLAISNVIGGSAVNGLQKYKAFGEFLVSSLIEMDEKDALGLVEKFTSDLVKNLIVNKAVNIDDD